jgi:hypothetical protein
MSDVDLNQLNSEVQRLAMIIEKLWGQNQALRQALTTQLRWTNELMDLGGATVDRKAQIRLALKDIEKPDASGI